MLIYMKACQVENGEGAPHQLPRGGGVVTPEVGEQAGVVITLVTYHLSLGLFHTLQKHLI